MATVETARKGYVIGLDIGSTLIKLAVFKRTEEGLEFIKADAREIGHAEDDLLLEKKTVYAVRELLKEANIDDCDVVVSVDCPATMMTKVTLPLMTRSELPGAIQLAVRDRFSVPLEEVVLEHELVRSVSDTDKRRHEVIVVGSPKKTVERYLSIMGKAGITPASLIPPAYAIKTLAEKAFSTDEKTKCFVNMGSYHTELIIIGANNYRFFRMISVAGEDFTKALTTVLASATGEIKLSMEEAERIKREIGFPAEGEDQSVGGNISADQVRVMLTGPAERLLNEIDRSFAYFAEEGGEQIDALVLFGGGASITGLARFLSKGLGVEVRMGNPLEWIAEAEKVQVVHVESAHKYGVAVGAALTAGGGINLLPFEVKEADKIQRQKQTVKIAFIAVAITLAVLYLGLVMQVNGLNRGISSVSKQLKGIEPAFKKAEAHHLAETVLVNEPHWEDIFKELSNLVPSDIYLTSWKMQNNVMMLEGVVDAQDGEQKLSQFILALERGIFRDVKLIKSRDIAGREGNSFVLRCRVEQ